MLTLQLSGGTFNAGSAVQFWFGGVTNPVSNQSQVANVNAITRFVLVLPDMIAIFFAFSMMYKAMYALLPADDAAGSAADEFWRLLARREESLADGAAALAASDVQSRAARQAREEFGLH